MKVIISETQRKKLREQNLISYAPERIDDFVTEGNRMVEKYNPLVQSYYNKLLHVTIHWVFDNLEEFKQVMDGIEKNTDKAEELATKYFNVVDIYDFMNYPDNVKQLDGIYTKLEQIQADLKSIYDVYEAIYSSVEHFTQWNKDIVAGQQIMKI